MTRTCRVCGRPEIRRHRHGEGYEIKLGRFTASAERRWMRFWLRQARGRLDRT